MKFVLSRQQDCFGVGGLVGLVVVVAEEVGWEHRNQNQSLLVAFEVGRWWRVG